MQLGSLFLRVIASEHRSSSLNLKLHRVTINSTIVSLITLFVRDHQQDQHHMGSTFDIVS